MSDKSLSAAKVVDGILILSLPDAVNPVVWQMELGQTKSSALEVRPQNDNNFMLVLKTARQDVLDIAAFTTKDLAVQALMTVSRALERAQGQINASFALTALPQQRDIEEIFSGSFTRKFWMVLRFLFRAAAWLAGLAVIAFILMFLLSHTFDGSKSSSTATKTSLTSSLPPNVPVSADDFLESR